jgi:hypothetical protein
VELPGQASDQHTAIVFHHLHNQAAAFFVKHEFSQNLMLVRLRNTLLQGRLRDPS